MILVDGPEVSIKPIGILRGVRHDLINQSPNQARMEARVSDVCIRVKHYHMDLCLIIDAIYAALI